MSGKRAVTDTSSAALRRLSGSELDALYEQFHRRVFAFYDGIDDLPEAKRGAAQVRARNQAEPLIDQARAVHAERVRRLRLKARRWWIATVAVAVAGSAAIAWLALR
ncbi:hypothetical protein ACW7G2_04445 [Luteimonas sp. A277]